MAGVLHMSKQGKVYVPLVRFSPKHKTDEVVEYLADWNQIKMPNYVDLR